MPEFDLKRIFVGGTQVHNKSMLLEIDWQPKTNSLCCRLPQGQQGTVLLLLQS